MRPRAPPRRSPRGRLELRPRRAPRRGATSPLGSPDIDDGYLGKGLRALADPFGAAAPAIRAGQRQGPESAPRMRGERRQHTLCRFRAAAAEVRSAAAADGGVGAAYSANASASALAFVRECQTFELGFRECHRAAAGAARPVGAAGGGTGFSYSASPPVEALRYET